MTRAGFLSLAIVLGLGFVASTWLLASVSTSSLALEEMRCDEWLASPREGVFRLTECRLDLTQRSYARGTLPAYVVVRADEGPRLAVATRDPDVVGRAWRIGMEEPAQRTRTIERYGEELVLVRTIEGEVIHRPSTMLPETEWELAELELGHWELAIGLVPAIACALGLLWLVLAQRRWTARSEAARRSRGGSTKPAVF